MGNGMGFFNVLKIKLYLAPSLHWWSEKTNIGHCFTAFHSPVCLFLPPPSPSPPQPHSSHSLIHFILYQDIRTYKVQEKQSKFSIRESFMAIARNSHCPCYRVHSEVARAATDSIPCCQILSMDFLVCQVNIGAYCPGFGVTSTLKKSCVNFSPA